MLAGFTKRAYGATHHVETVPWRIASDDVDLLVGVEPHNVLESHFLVGQDSTAATSSARDDLEVDKMDVYGMAPT